MRSITNLLGIGVLLLGAGLLRAEAPPKIDAVSAAMKDAIAKHEIAGAVTLVATKDKIVHLDAVGHADVAGNVALQPDSIMWIASMTKPITAVCVMMLVDEGKLSLDDPVSKYIPEFAGLKTADGKTHAVTIRQMLSHTSGMGEAGAATKTARTLADLVPVYAAKPLGFVPGSKWQYCQSSINMSARVVEIVSGKSFPDFLEERLCKPLGMKDTTFYLTDAQVPRLAKSYKKTGDKLDESPVFILDGHAATSRDRYPAANGGLFSTAGDYARFCQMLLRGGELDGKRILKEESVKMLSSLQTGDLKTGFTPGNGWGVGVCIIREPQGVSAALSPGSYGHGGAFGTQAWIDPVKGRVFVLMVQRANFPNADASDVRKAFQDAVK